MSLKSIIAKSVTSLIAIALIVLIVSAAMSVTIVDPGERAVKVRNGEVVGTLGNGVHFITPGAERARVFDMRTSVYQTSASALTKDSINANVTVTVRWDIRESELEDVYRNTAVNQQALVENAVRDAVVGGIKTSRQFSSENLSTEAYPDAVKAEISKRFKERGLVVRSVTIDNINYPPSVAKKFRKQQQAEAQKKIAQNELEEARVNAKKKIVQAENKQRVIEIRSESLTPLYVDYLEAKNIDKSDTVYVIPSGSQTNVSPEIKPSSNGTNAGT